MSILQQTVDVSKEASEVANLLAKLVDVIHEQIKDGVQLSQDIPPIIGVIISDLQTAIEGADKIPGEFSTNPEAFLNAWTIAGNKIISKFLKKA